MPSFGGFLTLNKSQPISPQQCRALSVQGWAALGVALPAASAALPPFPRVTLVSCPACAASPAPSCEKREFKLSLENASVETLCVTLLGFHIFCFLSRRDPGNGSRVRAESKVLQRTNAG